MPPRMSLLREVMRQLLSDVDLETINTGRIPDHLDELLWDGLKVCFLFSYKPYFEIIVRPSKVV